MDESNVRETQTAMNTQSPPKGLCTVSDNPSTTKRKSSLGKSLPSARVVNRFRTLIICLAGLEVTEMKQCHIEEVNEKMRECALRHASLYNQYSDGVMAADVTDALEKIQTTRLWKLFQEYKRNICNVITPAFLDCLDSRAQLPSGKSLEEVLLETRKKLACNPCSDVSTQDMEDSQSQVSRCLMPVDSSTQFTDTYMPMEWLAFVQHGMPAAFRGKSVAEPFRLERSEGLRNTLRHETSDRTHHGSSPNSSLIRLGVSSSLSRKHQRQKERDSWNARVDTRVCRNNMTGMALESSVPEVLKNSSKTRRIDSEDQQVINTMCINAETRKREEKIMELKMLYDMAKELGHVGKQTEAFKALSQIVLPDMDTQLDPHDEKNDEESSIMPL